MAINGRPHVPLNNLRAVEASIRLGGFAAAAEELHVTPAAVSQQVRAVEERYGVRLFTRLPRGLAPTSAALALAEPLGDAFDTIVGALDRLARPGGPVRLRVSLVATFALSWLVPRLTLFQRENPDIELILATHNNRPVDFVRERIDVAIRFGTGPESDQVIGHPILPYSLTPLAAPTLAKRLTKPEDLTRVPLIATDDTLFWDVWCEAAGITAARTYSTLVDSTRVMIEAAIEGAGVAIGSPVLFADDIADERLIQPFDLVVPSDHFYWLLLPTDAHPCEATDRFCAWIERMIDSDGSPIESGARPPPTAGS